MATQSPGRISRLSETMRTMEPSFSSTVYENPVRLPWAAAVTAPPAAAPTRLLRTARLPPRGEATSPIAPPTNAPVAASDCNWICWTLRTVPNRIVDPWPTRCASPLPTAASERIQIRCRMCLCIRRYSRGSSDLTTPATIRHSPQAPNRTRRRGQLHTQGGAGPAKFLRPYVDDVSEGPSPVSHARRCIYIHPGIRESHVNVNQGF